MLFCMGVKWFLILREEHRLSACEQDADGPKE
jgi:hypothetical protein